MKFLDMFNFLDIFNGAKRSETVEKPSALEFRQKERLINDFGFAGIAA